MSKGGRYEALPQFTESDSDVDIFNAKAQPVQKSYSDRRKGCNRKILIAFFAVTIVVVTIAVVFGALTSRGLRERNRFLQKHVSLVSTKAGKIAGKRDTIIVKNVPKVVYKFNGIPYAEPPVGIRRWSRPEPKGNWSGTYTADKEKIRCIQYREMALEKTKEPSEDCLYLHVFTPNLDVNAKLPIFVWLHGGYSLNGYSDQSGYSPDSEFVASMNVVAVNVNFRLNAFGYLTLSQLWKTNESYGNYGMMDQILALQWIQENIVQFGGDPSSVTLVGQSSGGTSILALIASPKADGLLHRAISMSGSPYFPKMYKTASEDNKVFLENSKCKDMDDGVQKECLYNLTKSEVLGAIPGDVYPFWGMDDLQDFPVFGRKDGMLFVVEPTVLPKPPKDVASLTEMTTKVSVLIGNTAQEPGIGSSRGNDTMKKLMQSLEINLNKFGVDYSTVMETYKKICTDSDNETMYETLVTDVRTSCPSNKLLKAFRQSSRLSNTYRFVVTYKPSKPVSFDGKGETRGHNSFHALDAFSLFGMKLFKNYTPTEQDEQFIQTLRSTVKRFMTHGTVDSAEPGDTILFTSDGTLKSQTSPYREAQCKIWDKEAFQPYAWVN